MLSRDQRHKIKTQIQEKLKQNFAIKLKQDDSFVTEIDLFISDLVKSYIPKNVCFYSEEDHSTLTYPCVILDPIDGTKELVNGIGECALSFVYLESSDFKNAFAWIYNPFTGFEISSDDLFIKSKKNHPFELLGLVSSSEWEKGLYKNIECSELILSPRGSIAYKLGLLAAGSCDFVVTKKPKNLWDIAAGTTLCLQRDFLFCDQGIIKHNIEKTKYEPLLIWSRSQMELEKILKVFS